MEMKLSDKYSNQVFIISFEKETKICHISSFSKGGGQDVDKAEAATV